MPNPTLNDIVNNWKYVSTALGIFGTVWGLFAGYRRVVDWATNLKDNHLHTIEKNTSNLIDKTEKQTEVLIGMSAKIDVLTDVMSKRL